MNSAHSFTAGADVPAPTVDEEIARQAKAGTLTQAMNPAPTPRTDRVEARVWGRYKQAEDITPEDNAREAVKEACNHARTLERELAAKDAEIKSLREKSEVGRGKRVCRTCRKLYPSYFVEEHRWRAAQRTSN